MLIATAVSNIFFSTYLMLHSLQRGVDAAQQRDPVKDAEDKIYYGTNTEFINHFNDVNRRQSFSDPSDPSLVKRFPQVMVIGASKTGTEALGTFLDLHPLINSVPQEVLWFKYRKDFGCYPMEEYLRRMPFSKKYEITLERSPQFANVMVGIEKKVPERIHSFDPSMKLIFVARNPIDRAISDHRPYEKANLTDSFEEMALRKGKLNTIYAPISNSLYYESLKPWYDLFSKNQIHIVDGDGLKSNPTMELSKVEDFLHVNHSLTEDRFYFNQTKGYFCYYTTPTKDPSSRRCMDSTKGHKTYAMSMEFRKKVNEEFAPHNEKFYELVGQNFGWE